MLQVDVAGLPPRQDSVALVVEDEVTPVEAGHDHSQPAHQSYGRLCQAAPLGHVHDTGPQHDHFLTQASNT
jgi:hypothetical protein